MRTLNWTLPHAKLVTDRYLKLEFSGNTIYYGTVLIELAHEYNQFSSLIELAHKYNQRWSKTSETYEANYSDKRSFKL